MKSDNVGAIRLDRSEPYLDGADLDALIQVWLDDCADRLDGLGPNGYIGTTAGYAEKITYFRLWWADAGPLVGWRLTQRGLREFERWLRMRRSRYGTQLMYHTRRDALRRLRQMFRWSQREGYLVNVAPADWVPAASGDPPVRRLVPDEALGALLAAAAASSQPARNTTILAVLIGTGIRRAECAALNIEDVSFADGGGGALLIRHPKRTRRGLIVRNAAFDEATGDYLLRWLLVSARISGPLFPSSRGGGNLTPMGLGRVVRRIWDRAGLVADQPVHDLRRAFVTDWRRQHVGEDVDDLLQQQVGHADGVMTSQYSLQGVEDVRKLLNSPMTRVGVTMADFVGLATA